MVPTASRNRLTAQGCHLVASKLMLQHLNLMAKRHIQTRAQIIGAKILFDAVGAATEPALSPA